MSLVSPKSLHTLFRFNHKLVMPDSNPSIAGITSDSRKVQTGYLFAALPGNKQAGTEYIEQAIKNGAAAILAPDTYTSKHNVPIIKTDDIRRTYALAVTEFFEHPSHSLQVIGITGTNGKTTTTFLLEQICKGAGKHTAVIGTVSYRIKGKDYPAPLTTPPAEVFQELLASMVAAGVEYVICEISSHALEQHRISGTKFCAVAFSNLTQDHLDYHLDMESYYLAKKLLFSEFCAPQTIGVINIDDSNGLRLYQELSSNSVVSCSADGKADAHYAAQQANISLRGIQYTTSYTGQEHRIQSPLLGRFNLDNLVLAVAIAHECGFSFASIQSALKRFNAIPGRFEQVHIDDQAQSEIVLVDYAHTPDALERALEAVNQLNPNRTICVFGCGGDRDKGKRPIMGEIVAKNADIALVTSDNPRTEDPNLIIQDILRGVSPYASPYKKDTRTGYLVDANRRAAISLAIQLAEADDVVLIAGKGHEDYQILGETKIHFSDMEEAKQALAQKYGAQDA